MTGAAPLRITRTLRERVCVCKIKQVGVYNYTLLRAARWYALHHPCCSIEPRRYRSR